MNYDNFCTCKGHNTGDFVRLTDFYCSCFQPAGWDLEYTSPTEESACMLYITGHCSICFGFTPDAELRAEAARMEAKSC